MENRILSSNRPLRLSLPPRQLIVAGLGYIAANHYFWVNKIPVAGTRPDLSWACADKGTYDQRFMDGILALRSRLASAKGGVRLRIASAYEVAALIVAARVALKRHQHGHHRLDIDRIDWRTERLLRRLETVRKRAKRAEIKRSGQDNYRQTASEWRSFVRWLRLHFLDCRCSRKRRLTPARHRRATIDRLAAWTRAELIDRQEPLPPERELRRLVRLFLRYVRRGRRGWGVRHLMNNQVFAASQIATFVQIRMEKAAGKTRKTS